MTSLIHSMSRKGWRACVFVFNVKDEVCFEMWDNLWHLSFLQGKDLSFLYNRGGSHLHFQDLAENDMAIFYASPDRGSIPKTFQ
jgi:hypothetical protein